MVFLRILFSLSFVLGQHVHVVVDVKKILAQVDDSFLSFNIDAASLYEGPKSNTSRVNFTNQGLRDVASTFCQAGGGAILRIGGSSADDLFFFETPAKNPPAPPGVAQEIIVESGYWDELMEFVDHTQCKLVWDLCALSMRNPDNTWNSTNAEKLLTHIHSKKQPVHAFQLGNEPGHWFTRHYPDGPNAKQLGKGFNDLQGLIDKIWGSAAGRPGVQGPDVCNGHLTDTNPCATPDFFGNILRNAQGSVDEVTVHYYGLIGPKDPNHTNCHLADFMDPAVVFNTTNDQILSTYSHLQQLYSPASKLVLGETATTGDGGCPGLSNTFAAGFWYTYQLGRVASLGYNKLYRQDLIGYSGIGGGSSYALAGDPGWTGGDEQPALHPNPDFFTSLLHKELTGSRTLAATTTTTATAAPTAVLHASCARHIAGVGQGALVLSFVNLAATEAETIVTASDGTQIATNSRIEYFMAPASVTTGSAPVSAPNFASRFLSLNGSPALSAPKQAADLLSLGRHIQDGTALRLPPLSYGFVVLPEAQAPACV